MYCSLVSALTNRTYCKVLTHTLTLQ